MINYTNNDAKYVNMAIKEAEKSDLRAKLGCVAVVSGKVIARGSNNYRTYSKDGMIERTCTCHAEINVLRKCLKQNIKKKICLYIARVTFSGDFVCSAPCEQCVEKMKMFNIKTLTYFDDYGHTIKTNFRDYSTDYLTSGQRAILENKVKFCI